MNLLFLKTLLKSLKMTSSSFTFTFRFTQHSCYSIDILGILGTESKAARATGGFQKERFLFTPKNVNKTYSKLLALKRGKKKKKKN